MSEQVAVVTGGAGFIGRRLVAALISEGTHVRVLDVAPAPPALAGNVDYTQGSILDDALCRKVFAGADEVYHVAGLAHLWARDPRMFQTVNGEGTRIVLEASRACGAARVVVTSTEVILRGWRDPNPLVCEYDVLPPLKALAGPYSRSKAIAHRLSLDAIERGQDVRIVYPTVPVGAGDDAFTSPTAMIRDFVSRPPPAYLDCRLNLVDAGDVARGHVLAARAGRPKGRYILGGQDLWMHEILALLEDLSGVPMPRRRIPFALALLAGTISTGLANGVTRQPPRAPLEGVRLSRMPREVRIDEARRHLGYAPGPVREALAETIIWLAEHGHIAKRLDLGAPQPAKRAL